MEISALNTTSNNINLPDIDIASSSAESENEPELQTQSDLPEDKPSTIITPQQISEAVETVNETLKVHNVYLDFSVHDETNQIMVKVMDKTSGEIIREIPPEKTLDMAAMTWEQIGLIIDEKA